MREDERQKRLKPLVVAVERWAADRRVGRSDGWEVAREELRSCSPVSLKSCWSSVLSGSGFTSGPVDFQWRSARGASQSL